MSPQHTHLIQHAGWRWERSKSSAWLCLLIPAKEQTRALQDLSLCLFLLTFFILAAREALPIGCEINYPAVIEGSGLHIIPIHH
ncbi:hypothetical protein CBS63078_4982 [Aspergillus niger]|nr:hypothetical protein CBS12448_6253 [Aspergillus niger]KAI2906476.1 hypothetical protein CBS11852_900 [Aspergillus niger]KAI2906818.1 hypothetical protein CBS63078_4982 [Aspergillus niger]KAI2929523.1 hypothetical protein CBS147320_3856 [Aspergillus niger]KAI2939751.1 hypothetical protein CBS147321_6640 [Aspergillus niger]